MRWLLRAAVMTLILLMGVTPAFAGQFSSQPSASATYAAGTLAAPTGLTCTSVVSAGVDLAWTAPVVTTPSLLRYTVLRRPNGGSSFTTVTSGLTAASYHDNPGIGAFNYVVAASYHSWTSPNSTQITATLAVVLSLCS